MLKKILGLMLVVISVSYMFTFALPAKVYAAQPVKIYINPPSIINQTKTPGNTFQIMVRVENITNLVGIQFKVSWDPTILNGVSMDELIFHNVTGTDSSNIWELSNVVDTGSADYAFTFKNITRALQKGYAPINGSYNIARITLQVVGVGKTVIDLTGTKLGAPGAIQISHDAFSGFFQNSPPPAPAQVFVDPSRVFDLNLTPSHSFTVNVSIANASDVMSLEFKLGFDPSVLHVTGIISGNFIPLTVTPITAIDNVVGFVSFNAAFASSQSGNGTLATITFHVEALGKSALHLYDVILLDVIGQALPNQTYDGSFNNVLLAKLAVQPDEIIDPTLLPPATFTINVTIADIEDLYGYEFNLTFDPGVLICLQVEIHDVLNETNYVPNQIIDNTVGYVKVNVTYYPPAVPLIVSTPTPLVTIKFRVKAIGASNLTLTDTNLVGSSGQPITHETHDGFFQSLIRDIAVINAYATPAQVYRGQNTTISVVVRNDGNLTETFTVNVYHNNSLIGAVTITSLAPSANATGTIVWNTTGVAYGNHTIKAEAPPLPFETNTANNVFIDGNVGVKIPGDINGDGIVDLLDAVLASVSFGSTPGDPNWNPAVDLNGDGVIDIFDVVVLAINFGQHE